MERFLDLVKQRYSVRSFLDKPVPDDQLQYILECGRLAPSAANFQPLHVIVVRQPGLKEKLAATYPRDWFKLAPLILVFCGDHHQGWKRADGKDHTDIDLAIMIDHITLGAAEIGLGTCWVCNFDAAMCRLRHSILEASHVVSHRV